MLIGVWGSSGDLQTAVDTVQRVPDDALAVDRIEAGRGVEFHDGFSGPRVFENDGQGTTHQIKLERVLQGRARPGDGGAGLHDACSWKSQMAAPSGLRSFAMMPSRRSIGVSAGSSPCSAERFSLAPVIGRRSRGPGYRRKLPKPGGCRSPDRGPRPPPFSK